MILTWDFWEPRASSCSWLCEDVSRCYCTTHVIKDRASSNPLLDGTSLFEDISTNKWSTVVVESKHCTFLKQEFNRGPIDQIFDVVIFSRTFDRDSSSWILHRCCFSSFLYWIAMTFSRSIVSFHEETAKAMIFIPRIAHRANRTFLSINRRCFKTPFAIVIISLVSALMSRIVCTIRNARSFSVETELDGVREKDELVSWKSTALLSS